MLSSPIKLVIIERVIRSYPLLCNPKQHHQLREGGDFTSFFFFFFFLGQKDRPFVEGRIGAVLTQLAV